MTPRQRQWLKAASTVASTTVHLSRASSPIAWVSAGITMLSEFIGDTPNEPQCWPRAPWGVRAAIMSVATDAQLGRVVSRDRDGDEIREYDGCRFGYRYVGGREWTYGPSGNPVALARWIWEHLGPSIQIESGPSAKATLEGVSLKSDPLSGAGLCDVGRQALGEISALRDGGKRVGVLFDGRRGAGKSWTMRAIAAGLGGFSLRARLADVRDEVVLGLVDVLSPKTVIFDDIDRGRTSQALDLAEVLTSRGVVALASCNRTDKVDNALIRARRFGLHYRLGDIDRDLLRSMVGDRQLGDAMMAELASRTVAEVAEFIEHFDHLGLERARQIMCERADGSDDLPADDVPTPSPESNKVS